MQGCKHTRKSFDLVNIRAKFLKIRAKSCTIRAKSLKTFTMSLKTCAKWRQNCAYNDVKSLFSFGDHFLLDFFRASVGEIGKNPSHPRKFACPMPMLPTQPKLDMRKLCYLCGNLCDLPRTICGSNKEQITHEMVIAPQ